MPLPFFTIGHSTRTIDDFAAILGDAGVSRVVDIRTVARSRTNPQYNATTLGGSLAQFSIDYVALPDLGGLRPRSNSISNEVNGFWKNRSFHNYADYALGEKFSRALNELIALGRERRLAMMCSEAVWWRCHRRIVADNLLARDEVVFHLMGGGRVALATLTPGVAVTGNHQVTYPLQA